MRSIQFSAVLLVFSISVTFFSCKHDKKPAPAREAKGDVSLGGTFRISESVAPATLDPYEIEDGVSSRLATQIHCGLLRLDPITLEVVPGLAESWSADEAGTSYVFHLRKGAKFAATTCEQSGAEVTAQDVVFSFEKLCAATGKKAYASTFEGRVVGADLYHNGSSGELQGVRAIDDYTISIELTKPDPSFLFVLAQPTTAIISKAAYDNCESAIVGAGPFVPGSEGNEFVLTRNPGYFISDAFGNQLPYIDTLIVSILQTKELQLEAFFAGKLDVVEKLHLDPVRNILEQHMADFSGKDPNYIMERDDNEAGTEVYSIYRKGVAGLPDNMLGYCDNAYVQLKQH